MFWNSKQLKTNVSIILNKKNDEIKGFQQPDSFLKNDVCIQSVLEAFSPKIVRIVHFMNGTGGTFGNTGPIMSTILVCCDLTEAYNL
jgi:hypothetical protein